MNINQIYTIVNEVAKQSLGSSAINVVDTGSFVSLGDSIISSANSTDAFLSKLMDKVGKTVISVRKYNENNKNNLVKEPFEYGAILQKIYVDLPESRENDTWNVGNDSYNAIFAPVIKPNVNQKLFDSLSTWETAVTIPDNILKTAFRNETEMGVFISGIFTTLENSMSVALENMNNMCRCNFIARKLNDKTAGVINSVNLLKLYNDTYKKTLTAENCLLDKDFLAFASQQILLYPKRLTKMSRIFNCEKYARHTPKENLCLDVLQNFKSASDIYLQSNTYHKELVTLPNFNEIPYWQSTSNSYNDCDKISVKLDSTNTVTKNGVLAVMYDSDAMGTTINNPRTTTERNNHDEYTNYYYKSNIGYFNDLSENGIVFYVENASK